MGWFRRKAVPPLDIHRGRIYRDGGWWRYRCYDCDYGAGALGDGVAPSVVFPWVIELSTAHAHPCHWSRGKHHPRTKIKCTCAGFEAAK